LFLLPHYSRSQTTPTGAITGVGNFSHIVTSLEKSVEFYRDVIGLPVVTPPQQFSGNPPIMKMGNTPGAQSRIAVLKAPGTAIGVELIEYKDIDRKPANPRFQDPGAANLQVRVRDLDAVVARVKKSGAHILTAAGTPSAIAGGTKVMFIQDPDGFVLELLQPGTLPAPTAENSTNIIGTGFEATAEDATRTAAFYRDLLGFQMSPVAAYNGDKLMTDTAGTPGAQFRQTRATIPGVPVTLTFIEFKDIDRKPVRTRVQDPGTAILQLMVKDVDSLLTTLKKGGATVIATDGQSVAIGTSKIALVRDPNNLILEFIQRP
jgi:predicted enzyme related to lactoylglutathione lyase